MILKDMKVTVTVSSLLSRAMISVGCGNPNKIWNGVKHLLLL